MVVTGSVSAPDAFWGWDCGEITRFDFWAVYQLIPGPINMVEELQNARHGCDYIWKKLRFLSLMLRRWVLIVTLGVKRRV